MSCIKQVPVRECMVEGGAPAADIKLGTTAVCGSIGAACMPPAGLSRGSKLHWSDARMARASTKGAPKDMSTMMRTRHEKDDVQNTTCSHRSDVLCAYELFTCPRRVRVTAQCADPGFWILDPEVTSRKDASKKIA